MTGIMLTASMVFGGATHAGYLGDVALQTLALPLIFLATLELMENGAPLGAKAPLVFVAMVLVLPILQLVPLPDVLWNALPGRSMIAETFELIDQQCPALPLTMSPSKTWASALAILPPLSIFLGCMLLTGKERWQLARVVVGLAVFSVFIGLAQLAGGPESPLRFYAVTNKTEAVGFFANRNHFAAMLCAALVLAICWLADVVLRLAFKRNRRTALKSKAVIELLAVTIALFLLLAGQAMTRSRAGLFLSILAVLGGVALIARDLRATVWREKAFKAALAGAILAIALSQAVSLPRMLDRFPDSIAGSRMTMAATTINAAKDYMPFGSGLGTFVPVYQLYEAPIDIGVTYVNHAHNDLLELWLETGLLGPMLAAFGVFWIARRAIILWSDGTGIEAADLGLMRAASLVLLLLLMHELVDYPLRTSAIMGVAAFAAALLIPPRIARI